MVKLGGHFPAALRDMVVDSKLSAGSVIRVKCDFTIPAPKEKLLVILCSEPEVLVYVINSEINPFIRGNQDLLQCQVEIVAEKYDFLHHNSFINCSETKTESNIGDLRGKMAEKLHGMHLGNLDAVDINEVIAATKFARTISKEHKKAILAALEAVINP